MDWFQPLNIYCERQTFGFWSEPVNALTNLIFVALGLILSVKTKDDWFCFFLSLEVIVIGLASFIFHTFANLIAALADILSILLFGMTYIFVVNLRLMNVNYLLSLIIAICLIPFSFCISFITIIIFGELNGSSWYISFVILFLVYSYLLRNRCPDISIALFYFAPLLAVSIILRSIDHNFCNNIPLGTHFLWHIINGILLSGLVWYLYRTSKINFKF